MTLENFFVLLEQSQLLTHEQIATLRADPTLNGAEIRPLDAARRLVERKLLTTWQAQMLLVGRTAFKLGRYRLLSELGRGGMGAVFKAEQGQTGRIVALKVMAGDLVRDENAVARFRREIEASSALNHPNVVGAFDAGHDQNTHFLVMEYVEGEGLDALLARAQRLPVGQACEIVRQAALGLQHAHEVGMAHRDIKPSNLLLTPPNPQGVQVVKIMDLGLARFTNSVSDETGLTRTGQVMGTPDYVAPEQAVDTKTADIRSDIFSLGCTLFRALTGRLPFEGRNVMEKLMARAVSDAPRLRSCVPQAPAELDAVLAKMLAREPADRYQTPAEVVQALEPFLALQQVLPAPAANSPALERPAVTPASFGAPTPAPAHPASPLSPPGRVAARSDPLVPSPLSPRAQERTENVAGETLTRAAERNAAVLGAVRSQPVTSPSVTRLRSGRWKYFVGGALALILLGGWGWWFTGTTYLVVAWPPAEREQGTLEVDGAPVMLPAEGELRLAGRPGQRTLKLVRPGYEPLEGRWTMVRGKTLEVPVKWRPLPEVQRRTAWERLRSAAPAPQAESTAEYRLKLSAFARRWRGSDESQAAKTLLRSLRWPIDALSRAEIPDYELRVAGAGDPARAPKQLVAILGDTRFRHSGAVLAATLLDEGNVVVSLGSEGVVSWWDATNGTIRKSMSLEQPKIVLGAMDAAGKLVVVANEAGDVVRCDLDSGKSRVLYNLQRSVYSLALSHDGALLAVGRDLGYVELRDAAQGTLQRELTGHTGMVRTLGFSRDNARLASGGEDGTVRLWRVADGSQATLETLPVSLSVVAFNPEGNLLVSIANDARLKFWNVESGKLEREGFGLAYDACALAFTSDGSRMVTGGGQGDVNVWDVATGVHLHYVKDLGRVNVLRFTSDGKTLLTGDSIGLLQTWDLKSRFPLLDRAGHRGTVHTACVCPDGQFLVSGGTDGFVVMWNLPQRTVKFDVRDVGNFDLAFTPQSLRLVIAGSLGVNYLDSGYNAVTMMSPRSNWVMSVAVSDDGKLLASGGSAVTTVAPIDKPDATTALQPEGGWAPFSFSPNSKLLAAIGGATVRLWDPSNGQALQSMPAEYAGTSAVFLDDRRLLVGLQNGTLCVWNVETAQVTAGSERHVGAAPIELDLSPDRTTAVSVVRSQTIQLWDVRGDVPEPLGPEIPVTPAGVPVWRARFTPDGRHVVTGNGNGTVYVLRLQERPVDPAEDSAAER